MRKMKRLRKLLAAQEKLEGLAVAASARADQLVVENEAEQAAFLHNASGEKGPELSGIVVGLGSAVHRAARAKDLVRQAERAGETARAEGRLTRQLERLMSSRAEETRRQAERGAFAEQLEIMTARGQASAAPASRNKLSAKREDGR